MSNNNFIDNILNEINSGLNVTAVRLCVFSSLSFVLNMIIILDINKLKKENNKIKNLNYEIKQQNEKIKQQNEKILLKLSLLNDSIFNNHKLISDDVNLQRSNMLEIIDKTDFLIYCFKKINKNNKIDKQHEVKENKNEENKNEENKNEENKNEEKSNEEKSNEEKSNNKENDDNELLNECYDIMPCNNINKITGNNAKTLFGIF